jgi:class 3 adenylate cyclase
VTFLFTDVEGSTGGWEADEAAMDRALEDHDRILREVIVGCGGFVFSTGGDSFAAAFGSARAAVEAAIAGQRGVEKTGLAVRMGLHAGEAHQRDGDYFGPTVNRAARVMSVVRWW